MKLEGAKAAMQRADPEVVRQVRAEEEAAERESELARGEARQRGEELFDQLLRRRRATRTEAE